MKYSRARNSLRSSPFCLFFSFFFCARAREHPRKQFQRASGRERIGGETGAGRRGRDKNFLIGRIVEHPSQSYNFSIVSKLPDSTSPPRHLPFRSQNRFHRGVTRCAVIGVPLLGPRVSSPPSTVTRILAFRGSRVLDNCHPRRRV